MQNAVKVKPTGILSKPRGEYKFVQTDTQDAVITAYFTETNQFMVTTQEYAKKNLGYAVDPLDNNDAYVAHVAEKCDLVNRVKYLYTLLDEAGFRIYAVFVLGIVVDGVFKAFDIYAGVAGQGTFLPRDQVQLYLEQINVPEVAR